MANRHATPPTLVLSTLSNGAITNNPTLNVSGTVTDPGSGVKSLTINGTAVTVGANGAFSYPLTLSTGRNVITTIATDNAGNQTTDIRTITLDTAAPILTVTAPADNSATNQNTKIVTGTVNESSTVAVKVNSGSPQAATISGNSFSTTVNLTSGQNTIEIIATDLAGNASNSIKRTVTYDNSAPSLAITNPSHDITTSQSSITIQGTASDTLTAVTVTVSMDGQTYTPTVTGGSFTQGISFTVAKTYVISVTARDEANNTTTVQRNVIYQSTSGATIDLGSTSGLKGSQVTIPITLTNVAGVQLSTVRIDIGYDAALLLNPTVTLGIAGTNSNKILDSSSPTSGVVRVGLYDNNNTVLGNGNLANVTFTISSTATTGANILLTNSPQASNAAGDDITVTGTNGTVSVVVIPGDCNNDNSVTPGEFTSAINGFMGRAPGTSCVSFYSNVNVTPGYFTKVINAFMGR